MYKLIKENLLLCPVCESEIPEDADECPGCGLDRIIIELEEGGGENDKYVENLEKLLEDDSEDLVLDLDDALDDELELSEELPDEELDQELGLLEDILVVFSSHVVLQQDFMYFDIRYFDTILLSKIFSN